MIGNINCFSTFFSSSTDVEVPGSSPDTETTALRGTFYMALHNSESENKVTDNGLQMNIGMTLNCFIYSWKCAETI